MQPTAMAWSTLSNSLSSMAKNLLILVKDGKIVEVELAVQILKAAEIES